MNKEQFKDLLYDVYNEFTNDITDYTSKYKDSITDNDFDVMCEFLEHYIDKVELLLEEE